LTNRKLTGRSRIFGERITILTVFVCGKSDGPVINDVVVITTLSPGIVIYVWPTETHRPQGR